MKKILSKILATVLSFILVFGFYVLVNPVSAAQVTDASDVMTRHKISTAGDHTITFTTPTGVPTTKTITLTFESDFSISAIVYTDVDVKDDAVELNLGANCSATEDAGVSVSGQVLTIEICSDYTGGIVAASVVETEIGTNAAGPGVHQITNPTTVGSYEISIGGTMTDSGEVDVPIVDNDQVSISATVDTYISFDLDTPVGNGGSHTETATPYTVNLQELSFSSLTNESTASVTEIYIDLNCNADDGAIVQIKSANGATGLSSSSTSDNIPSATQVNVINSTNGNYGVAAIQENAATEGIMDPVAPFNVHGTANSVGGLTTSFQSIFDTDTAPVVNGDGEVAVRAVAGKSTSAADDYTDTLTFRATGTF